MTDVEVQNLKSEKLIEELNRVIMYAILVK